jgi:hypothetical protein
MVDFGPSEAQNIFEFPGWNRPIKGPYAKYSAKGPGGAAQIDSGNRFDFYCGISGPSRSFKYGERIIVTWYNSSSSNIEFIPLISFDDQDQPVNRPGEPQWYVLGIDHLPEYSGIVIRPRQKMTLYYDVYNGSHDDQVGISEGKHSLINICFNATLPGLICDKIELNNDQVDTLPPSRPDKISSSAVSYDRVQLSWSTSKDDRSVDRYRVYRDGEFISNSKTTSFMDTGLRPDTNYAYTVMAIDDYGNRGPHSDPVFAKTGAFTPDTSLINPYKDIRYLGAFRVPKGRFEDGIQKNFNWAGYGMTFYPGGDPAGIDDGYTGSIFAVGHRHNCWVAEYDIPRPVISREKDPSELNRAKLLQDFYDVFTYYPGVVTLPTPALEYLPRQGRQTSDKLYLVDASNFNWDKQPTHGWCELDLSNPQTKGPWFIGTGVGDYGVPRYYQYAGYIFSIPAEWADQNVPGYRLISGCCRSGGQSGGGPTMYAFGPWNSGNPPPVNANLKYKALLQYDDYNGDPRKQFPHYLRGDTWTDGAWLTVGGKSAVMLTGQKGFGEYWYGYRDGTRHHNATFKSIPPLINLVSGDKGPNCTGWQGQFVFYNPDDLALVARGKKDPWTPRPYAVLNIDGYLYKHNIISIAYDHSRSILYASERNADGEAVLVHVWKIGEKGSDPIPDKRNSDHYFYGRIRNDIGAQCDQRDIDGADIIQRHKMSAEPSIIKKAEKYRVYQVNAETRFAEPIHNDF